MISDQLQSLRQPIVVGGAHSAFAGMDMLVEIQAEDADMADGTAGAITLLAERRLRAVLDEIYPLLVGQRP